MKWLPRVEITNELDAQINESMRISGFRRADVIRQALRIGLRQFADRFQHPPLWLAERLREALSEPAELTGRKQF
ncbi:MAG: hypothetical protein ACREIC_18790, partial [Limisphaerales bacterium]